MAERLHAMNVGYRPLNPADDVSGLAGQRHAVTEFEAKSADMARSAAEENARAALALRVKENADRTMLATMQAANRKQEVRQQMQLSYTQLAQKSATDQLKLDQSQQQLDHAAALLPHEIDRMELENDAQLVENKHAEQTIQLEHDRIRAEISESRAKLGELDATKRELAEAPTWRAAIQSKLNGGIPLSDIPRSSIANPQTAEGIERLDQMFEDFGDTSKARLNKIENNSALDAFSGVSDLQQVAIEGIPGAISNGVPTELGRDWAVRFSKTNSAPKNDIEEIKRAVNAPTYSGSYSMWMRSPSKFGEWVGGQFVLTQAGVDEVADRQASREARYIESGVVVTDDLDPETGKPRKKTVTTKVPRNYLVMENFHKKLALFNKEIGKGAMTHRKEMEIYREARLDALGTMVDNENYTDGEVEGIRARGRIPFWIKDGERKELPPVGQAAGHVPVKLRPGAGLAVSPNASGAGGDSVNDGNLITQADAVESLKVNFSYDKNIKHGDVVTSIDSDTWEKKTVAHQVEHMENLRGKGASRDEAEELLREAHHIDFGDKVHTEGVATAYNSLHPGNDTSLLLEKMVNVAGDRINIRAADLGTAGMGFPYVKLTYGTHPPADMAFREMEETQIEPHQILWGETFKKPQWKKILDNKAPTNDWRQEPYPIVWMEKAGKKFGAWNDRGLPDTRGRHNLKLKGFKVLKGDTVDFSKDTVYLEMRNKLLEIKEAQERLERWNSWSETGGRLAYPWKTQHPDAGGKWYSINPGG
jgi:hypothetical protein